MSWRSSGWRPVVFYHWEHRAIRVIIISRAALDGFERALSCPERGSNTLLGSFPSLEGGGVARVKGDVLGRTLLRVGRQRVQRQRVLERDEQGGGGHAAFFLRCSFWTGTGWGCSPEGVGRGCRSDRGVCACVSDPLFWWGRPLSPPSVQHRPRVTYSGTAKGPLLGGLPIVSGLEGVCDVEEKETEGLNPAACYTKRLERCEGTRKQSEAWG